jgi:hypothetical protein
MLTRRPPILTLSVGITPWPRWCRYAIDTDASGGDPLLHFATRTDAGLGQNLLQAFRLGFGNRLAVAPD